VVTAINRKIEQYYISEEYKFRVAREIRESERKKIEAEGISEFQRIVSKGISDSYVRWRGIEATLQLAQSPNSKIVIVGNSKDGLPIILGNMDTPAAPSAPPPTAPDSAPKERTTAASPSPALEAVPADTLSNPAEKTPAAQPTEAPHISYSFPSSLPELEDLLGRLAGVKPAAPPAAAPSDAGAKPAPAEKK
jgi:hypothetical protein